ncbi:MAG: ATP-dependent protease ATPase subunit HslU [Phycisphaerales bacterium]
MNHLTPREIVAELDAHIIGQHDAKRAVAVAVRNRWRRQQLAPELAREVSPKNIIMVGPTGVGKTEIARRLASLTGAPFVKVEASKYTEVGYHGRDVESMVRDLLEIAINMIRAEQAEGVRDRAVTAVEDRLVDILMGPQSQSQAKRTTRVASQPADLRDDEDDVDAPYLDDDPDVFDSADEPPVDDAPADDSNMTQVLRERMRKKLREGVFDNREIDISLSEKANIPIIGMMGPDQLDPGMATFLEGLVPDRNRRRKVTVARARTLLLEEETDKLIDNEKLLEAAIERTEQAGIIFLDEIDKIASPSEGSRSGGSADVSRQGVQRDLLPIVEGSAVSTRHGVVNTDGILFIAAGAFHVASVSDLMPELQGRFPIRVELSPLTREDLRRILTEPRAALTHQQSALLSAEGLDVRFSDDAIAAIADFAADANDRLENIGARRLVTVIERVIEEISFDAPERASKKKDRTITIDAAFVNERMQGVLADEDLGRFVL